jgi:hypothetical protein
MPTTGFAAVLDVLSFAPRAVYLTGFDGFRSRLHNVDEPHASKNPDDPYRHEPERELAWLAENRSGFPLSCDALLSRQLETVPAAA